MSTSYRPMDNPSSEDHEFSDNEGLDDAINDGVAPTPSAIERPQAVETIAHRVTRKFLAQADIEDLRKCDPLDVSDEVLALINEQIELQNARVKNNEDSLTGVKITPLQRLNFPEVARLVAALHPVIQLMPSTKSADPDMNILAAYDDDQTSPFYGTYRSSQSHIVSLARRYSPSVTSKVFTEFSSVLEELVPVRCRGDNQDLVACNNGIVDYNGGNGPKFMPFSPEYVFVSKLDVDWNPKACDTPIHNDEDGTDWTVEGWIASLTDDEEVRELLWEIIGATVRPYVSWNQCAFFYADKGNNGKGTLLSCMRNILGEGNYASIPLSDFSKDFLMEPLTRASAILVDENDVGGFMEKSANFKAIITNDVITINRKYKAAIAHQHFGFMVQCLNDRPTIKDKSESIYRRQTIVPFHKSFTGMERKYIKDDYLKRASVLEYVLKRVLEMKYYALSQPQAIVDELNAFKIENDPTYAFWDEFKNEFTWDLVPFGYLHDLYKAWFERDYPTGKPLGKQKFTTALLGVMASDTDSQWECPNRETRHRPGSLMDEPQLLTVEYNLDGWINHSASKWDAKARSTMSGDMFKENYTGIRRTGVMTRDEKVLAGQETGVAGIPPDQRELDELGRLDEASIAKGAAYVRGRMTSGDLPMIGPDDSIEEYADKHQLLRPGLRRARDEMYPPTSGDSPFAADAGNAPSWGSGDETATGDTDDEVAS